MKQKVRLLWIKMVYLNMMLNGEKKLEARINYPNLREIKTGAQVCFRSGKKKLNTKIIAVRRYQNFSEMLLNENIDKLLPGYSFSKALKTYREIYPDEKVKRFNGVIVFEIK